ncbi:unnamed protein product [Cylicostephanus goldi]|uniref:Cytochrome P450 n=1 Tax=Cylicostephanus goldi TaxID=71465 RepID=A0A3P7N5Z0_CYLGO|nr:unnamed protein product [Cylicostephanus goldi]
MGGANGVVQIDGPKWREQRRFSLHVLRDFGVGRALMEGKIMDEVNAFATYLCENQGRVTMNSPIAVCVGNVINNMLFGMRFPQVRSLVIRSLGAPKAVLCRRRSKPVPAPCWIASTFG